MILLTASSFSFSLSPACSFRLDKAYEVYTYEEEKVGNPMGLAREILKLLKEKPRQTPRSTKEKVSFSRSTTTNVLIVLSDLGLWKPK